jgi:uncharacterized protein
VRTLIVPLLSALYVTITHAAAPTADYTVRWGEKIRLRDGVELNATLYLAQDAKAPVLFTLTPYTADSYHERAHYFAQHGYHFALVDTRGRGNSGGKFDPLRQELKDAADVVRFFAEQPYGSGEVAMWGGSYAGYNQWTAAADQPKGLFTIVPVASPYPGVDFPTNHGVPYPYVMQWLSLTSGALAQDNWFGQGDFWARKAQANYRGGSNRWQPLSDISKLDGKSSESAVLANLPT